MQHSTPEEWRPIPGHAGYEVSNYGRVRSYRSRQGHPIAEPRLMSPALSHYGYRIIKLGRRYQTGVHILVLTAFVGPRPLPDMECRHLNGNRADNHVSNLRWGTRAENYDDRREHGTANDGERHGNAKLTNTDVRAIRKSPASDSELAYQFGVSYVTIRKIRNGSAWRGIDGAPFHTAGRKGMQNGRAKLSDEQVMAIRASGLPRRVLSQTYGVCRNTIGQIQTGKIWKHLP